jgi:SAM-dependent methyltransferase
VDVLVERGGSCVTVLDLSASALARVRARLGERAPRVTWIEADVTAEWPVPSVGVWHDRAVFHFLTEAEDRARYVARVRQAVRPNGSVVIATFALDGPERCSGLPVRRYSAELLAEELGSGFELAESEHERHRTPSGGEQLFCYSRFRRREGDTPHPRTG